MARPLCIEFPGALYHLTSRGDRREPIYEDDEDRSLFLQTLAEEVKRCNWFCYAYCLMSNHYHLVIETPQGNLCKGMRNLNGIYTQACNRRHRCSGHLFQGRYKAILVDKESYLLELARYVVLNPVRAGIVGEAHEWPWSSERAMVGEVPATQWLAADCYKTGTDSWNRAGHCRSTDRSVLGHNSGGPPTGPPVGLSRALRETHWIH